MSESILNTVKESLGIAPDYDAFDTDIIMHINTALMVLGQLGIGPPSGYVITDEGDTWESVLGMSTRMAGAKSFVFLRVKRLFDPPATSFVGAAMDNVIKEMEWRLTVQAEGEPPNDG